MFDYSFSAEIFLLLCFGLCSTPLHSLIAYITQTFIFLTTYCQCDGSNHLRASRTTPGLDLEVAWTTTFGAERAACISLYIFA
jgi:hypothetical protein